MRTPRSSGSASPRRGWVPRTRAMTWPLSDSPPVERGDAAGPAGNAACRATTLMDQLREMTLRVCSLRARRARWGDDGGVARTVCQSRSASSSQLRRSSSINLIGRERRQLVPSWRKGPHHDARGTHRPPDHVNRESSGIAPGAVLAPRASTRRRDARARLVRGRSLKLPRGPKLPRLGPAAVSPPPPPPPRTTTPRHPSRRRPTRRPTPTSAGARPRTGPTCRTGFGPR